MRKLVSVFLILAMAIALVGCGEAKKEEVKTLKVGVILVGDETDNYTRAHIEGIKEAAANTGIEGSSIIWKYKIPDNEQCSKTAEELVAQGCGLIIANSYGHQDFIRKVAEKYKDVDFVAISGDHAAISGLDNFYNASTKIYEAKYVSGVVAGMKIKELADGKKVSAKSTDKDGNIKIGYVSSYPRSESVSGYTAFYLGIKSVYEKVAMEVTYTNTLHSSKKEAEAAKKLIKDNCVVIGQDIDSSVVSSACQKANRSGKTVYTVGSDDNMLSGNKKSLLTSTISEWGVYYTDLFKAAKDDSDIPQDWAQGFESGAVAISELGSKVAKGTKEAVDKTIENIKNGKTKVFDTKTFTVNGKEVESEIIDLSYMDISRNKIIFEGEQEEAIEDGAFKECTLRSAPYFNLKIDGITEVNAK